MSTATAAKERPILFSGEMVKAILADKKIQTRRIVKPQPTSPCVMSEEFMWIGGRPTCIWPAPYTLEDGTRPDHFATCPYGKPGDHLWVRETHTCTMDSSRGWNESSPNGTWPIYAATDREWEVDRWRPSIHMPRWASRITLEITDVRVERLQQISGDDAIAEGVDRTPFWRPKDVEGRPFEEKWWDDFHFWNHYPPLAFANLWDSINADRGFSWASNPFVWRISFRRIDP